MTEALTETIFHLPNQTKFYRGKVRDVYTISDKYLVMVASDRISAFDYILPKPIPKKGAILNTLAAFFLNQTKDIVPNWLIETPTQRSAVGFLCKTYPIEMVIRGNLCGHALREYNLGKRTLCGVNMPEGMKPYQAFPTPIITPATKAEEGHDLDISKQEIIAQGLVSKEDYEELERITQALFKRGQEYAALRGLILADTKYEFGKLDDKIILIDEIHTPDSSRYFYKEGFAICVENGTTPKQLSKEFVREWLMENGFQGLEGQQMPAMSDEVVAMISNRYLELFNLMMETPVDLSVSDDGVLEERLVEAIGRLGNK